MVVLQGGGWWTPQSRRGAHLGGPCSSRHSELWKPFLTGSAFSPMGMSTWRCLPRTCLRAVASSVGKGESKAAAPSSGAQAPRNGLLGWTVTEGSLGRKWYSFRMGGGSFAKTMWGPGEFGSRVWRDCCFLGGA